MSLLSYIPFLPGAKRDSRADVGRSDAADGVNDADDGGGEQGNAHGCTSAGQTKYPNYALNFNCSSISTFVAVHSFQGKSPAPSQISAPAQDAGRNQDANHPLNCNLSCTSTSTSIATSTSAQPHPQASPQSGPVVSRVVLGGVSPRGICLHHLETTLVVSRWCKHIPRGETPPKTTLETTGPD